MQYLRKLNNYYYEILGEPESKAKRFIVTTEESRKICNMPEIFGCDYTDMMSSAMVKALKYFPTNLSKTNESEICVVTFLRGGLNFNLRDALHKAFGFNKQSTSFMSSQRFKKDNRWGVKEDQYRKFIFPKNTTIFIGDVVATGVTVKNGMDVVFEALKENGSSVKDLFFFTIGCHKVEKVLDDVYDLFKAEFKGFKNFYVIYFEGKFKLADSKTTLKIKIQGTDLLRTNALLAPEFELSQYDSVPFCLERCTIYDAGSRAFDISEYLKDVREYWEQVLGLAKQGFTLYDAMKERWPEVEYKDYETFVKTKKGQWQNINEEFLKQLYGKYKQRWTPQFIEKAKTSGALIELCKKRIEEMH